MNPPPPAIVRRVQRESNAPAYRDTRLRPGLRAYLTRALFTCGNLTTEDGRSYVGDPNDGVSNFVSPLAANFLDSVEPLIRPLVRALHRAKIRVCSSCQGHHPEDPRYAVALFTSKEDADAFESSIPWWYPVLTTRNLVMSISKSRWNDFKVHAFGGTTDPPEELIERWNTMFNEDVRRYFPVVIAVCSEPHLYSVPPSEIDRLNDHLKTEDPNKIRTEVNFKTRRTKKLRRAFKVWYARRFNADRWTFTVSGLVLESNHA